MDETGQAMTDGPLEALHLAAQRCKDALETGDLQAVGQRVSWKVWN